MDARVRDVLDEMEAFGRAHDATRTDRLERLRNVEPATAQLLSVLVRAIAPRRMLELGTSNGYSTVWLAEALSTVGGRLISVDLDPARIVAASQNLLRAELAARVDLRVQDAAVTLANSADASWEMIFLDAERPVYPDYWPDLARCLAPGGLLVVDNVISHSEQLTGFRELIDADDRVSEAVAPTGAGALLVVRAREPRS